MKREEWRPVTGWPYEVSSAGRVRRDGSHRQGTQPWRVLTPWIGGGPDQGREYVTLRDRGDRADPYVHRLVALAFLGPAPFPDAEIDHLDGNPMNNAAENLEWVTKAENLARQHGQTPEEAEAAEELAEILGGDLPF